MAPQLLRLWNKPFCLGGRGYPLPGEVGGEAHPGLVPAVWAAALDVAGAEAGGLTVVEAIA
jgi:hypothetical protein